jgi:hypothetical protein
MLVTGGVAISAAIVTAIAMHVESSSSEPRKQIDVCTHLPPSPQIHQEEYPLQLKPRHEADLDEFSYGLDKVTKFYIKMKFTPRGPHATSLNAFLKMIGGEDQSNMDFGQLAAYMKVEKSNRYVLDTDNARVVWKTSAGAFRYARLEEMPGGFECDKFFHLIGVAKACGFSFRRTELTMRGPFGSYHHIEVRMHFAASPIGRV